MFNTAFRAERDIPAKFGPSEFASVAFNVEQVNKMNKVACAALRHVPKY